MERTLVIGDIHGGLKALIQVMAHANINKNDHLIFLGDYVDGWSESAQVIQYLIELSKTNDCVFIKGNHDVWCEDWLRNRDPNPIWLANGGQKAKESYSSFSEATKQEHLSFFESMPLYHLDKRNRLFIHAGFTSMHGVEHENNRTNFYFDRTLWEMALSLDKGLNIESDLYPRRLKHYSEIYIGHTPTIYYAHSKPMNAANVWNIDTGAAFTGKLTAVDIDTKEMFQSDILMDLYPDEKGRNK